MKVTFETGPHDRTWTASLVSGDKVLASTCCGRAHAGAWRKGAVAGIAGEAVNPYDSERGVSGLGILGRRGFRNAWDDGYEAARRAVKPPR